MANVILTKTGRNFGGRIFKNKSFALRHIKAIIRNNSLAQRKQVGAIGLQVRKYRLNDREKKELRKSERFIFN